MNDKHVYCLPVRCLPRDQVKQVPLCFRPQPGSHPALYEKLQYPSHLPLKFTRLSPTHGGQNSAFTHVSKNAAIIFLEIFFFLIFHLNVSFQKLHSYFNITNQYYTRKQENTPWLIQKQMKTSVIPRHWFLLQAGLGASCCFP